MKTYILAHTPEETMQALHPDIRLEMAYDVAQMSDILFKRADYFTESLLGIPSIAMWVGHEVEFYTYAGALLDALTAQAQAEQGLPLRAYMRLLEAYDAMGDEIWGADHNPDKPRVLYPLTTPLSTVSEEVIHSHWIDLIRTHPSYYVSFLDHDDFLDLSIDPIYEWRVQA
jgi:hypothetical protein